MEMKDLVHSIALKEYTQAEHLIKEALGTIVGQKLNEKRKMVAAKISVEGRKN